MRIIKIILEIIRFLYCILGASVLTVLGLLANKLSLYEHSVLNLLVGQLISIIAVILGLSIFISEIYFLYKDFHGVNK